MNDPFAHQRAGFNPVGEPFERPINLVEFKGRLFAATPESVFELAERTINDQGDAEHYWRPIPFA